jgi:hypothetical protein
LIYAPLAALVALRADPLLNIRFHEALQGLLEEVLESVGLIA